MLPVTRQFDAALQIVGELRAAGYEAYLAGGCVRDLLLGREPVDYDVATSATPDVVLRLFPRTFAVGAHFGVVLVATCGAADSADAGTCGAADSADAGTCGAADSADAGTCGAADSADAGTCGAADSADAGTCGAADSADAGTCGAADSADAGTCGAADSADAGTCGAADSADAGSESRFELTEVATFRSDGVYSDGRHPDGVRYTTSAEEDVRRRDFTINGLLLDPTGLFRQGLEATHPSHKDKGVARVGHPAEVLGTNDDLRSAVIDYVGGLTDLDAGVVRAIGRAELRFDEDHLRMLRGVRFAARFGFELEAGTRLAMRQLAARTASVSRERVRDELTKMLTEGRARRAFELLEETGLLAEVLPEVAMMKGVEQPPQFHPEGDVWTHTLLLLGQLQAGCPATLAWGALLHDVGKPPTFRRAPDRIRFDGHAEMGVAMGAEICRRFRFSNEETRQILALIGNHMRFMDARRMKASTLKRFFRLEGFEEHLALHKMDCLAGGGGLENWEFVRESYLAMPEETVRPRPLITGRELIAAGYVPGAGFKEMLRTVEDAQLEGAIGTAEEALQLVREHFPID